MRSLDLLFPRTSWPSLGFGLSPMAVATATKAVAQQSQPMVVFGPQLDVFHMMPVDALVAVLHCWFPDCRNLYHLVNVYIAMENHHF